MVQEMKAIHSSTRWGASRTGNASSSSEAAIVMVGFPLSFMGGLTCKQV